VSASIGEGVPNRNWAAIGVTDLSSNFALGSGCQHWSVYEA
jgi:hypothetical protein